MVILFLLRFVFFFFRCFSLDFKWKILKEFNYKIDKNVGVNFGRICFFFILFFSFLGRELCRNILNTAYKAECGEQYMNLKQVTQCCMPQGIRGHESRGFKKAFLRFF